MNRASLLLLLLVFARTALAAPADVDVDARLQRLATDLRCLVCQNQTLADSAAPLAVDLRREIREHMVRGDSDRQIVAFLVARYGDFVLYRPPLKDTTLLLWFGPGLMVLVVGLVLAGAVRRRGAPAAALAPAEQARLRALLGEEGAP